MGTDIQKFTAKEKKQLSEMSTEIDRQNYELMKMKISVTPDQDAFCHAFIITRNGPKAVMEAGLLPETCTREALYHRARKYMSNDNVMLRIRQLQLPMLYQQEVTCQAIINELMKMAFTDITDLLEIEEYKVDVITTGGRIKQVKRNSITIKAAEVEKLRKLGLGGVIQEVREQRGGSVRLVLADKMAAFKELRQILIGDRKQIFVAGSIKHQHSGNLSFVDLLNSDNTDPEKLKIIKQMYPEHHARKILGPLYDEIVVEDVQFTDITDNPKTKKKKKRRKKIGEQIDIEPTPTKRRRKRHKDKIVE